jgi:hypothetical protein
MYINTQEEIEISQLVQSLRCKSKDASELIKIREKLKLLIEDSHFHLLDVISDYLNTDKNVEAGSIFEGFLNELMQHISSEEKELVLFAVPVVLLEARVLNDAPYKQAKEFDNRLMGVQGEIAAAMQSSLPNVKITMHHSMLDYLAFNEGHVSQYRALFDEIKGDKVAKRSLLNGNLKYDIGVMQVFDNLKFMIGVMEIENKNDVPDVLSLMGDIDIDAQVVGEKLQRLLIIQNLTAAQLIIGEPAMLMTSLRTALPTYNYLSNLNVASKVLEIEPDANKIAAMVIMEMDTGAIRIDFYIDEKSDVPVYTFAIDYPIDSYEDEIRYLEQIMQVLEIKASYGKED